MPSNTGSYKTFTTECGNDKCEHEIKQPIPIPASKPAPNAIMITCIQCGHTNQAFPKNS